MQMPRIGYVQGSCDTMSVWPGDKAKYFTIFYSTERVEGLAIESFNGEKMSIGNTGLSF